MSSRGRNGCGFFHNPANQGEVSLSAAAKQLDNDAPASRILCSCGVAELHYGERAILTLAEAVEVIKAEAVVPAHNPGASLAGCFAADLMSDVLAFARENSLLITGLATDQTVRTAAVRHLAAIIVVEGKTPSSEMLETAQEEGIPLYSTPLSKYEVCGLLMQAGLRPYRRGVACGGSSQACGGGHG